MAENYNPATAPFSAAIPDFADRPDTAGLTVGNTLIYNNPKKQTPIVLSKEIKGGVHFVQYLEYLDEHSYRGVTPARRQLGMIAFVWKHWNNGADTELGKYYKLKELSADSLTAVWEELNFGSVTLAPNRVLTAATIAERDALVDTVQPPLVEGDIVIVADASGDTSVSPAITGGATYIRTGVGTWLRFLYPEKPDKPWHAQNTDTQLISERDDETQVAITGRALEDHMGDPHIHFRMNDTATYETAAATETLSARKIYDLLNAITGWQPKTDGDGTTFLNDQGNYVPVQTKIKRIDGGTASTVWNF